MSDAIRSANEAAAASGLASYGEYIRSERWQELRQAAIVRDGFRCRGCGSAEYLQVHHRRYPEILGMETVEDLTTLCGGVGSCHRAIDRAVERRRRKARRVAALAVERPTSIGGGDLTGPNP